LRQLGRKSFIGWYQWCVEHCHIRMVVVAVKERAAETRVYYCINSRTNECEYRSCPYLHQLATSLNFRVGGLAFHL
jgi:hypothetical protein